MFTLGVEYLLGRAIATDPARRDRPEWPPHPDRLYQAMVAAWAETDGTLDERRALEWLESQAPPALYASDAAQRAAVKHYVPVNDSRRASDLLPEDRPRQGRAFPCAIPVDPCVYFQWPERPPAETGRALESLVERVVRLGHSGSLVRMWIADDPPAANRVPKEGANEHRLRVPARGRVQQLENDYMLGRRPTMARHHGYGTPADRAPEVAGSIFDPDLLILARETGTSVGLEHTLRVTAVLRNTVIHRSPEPVPEWVSGHAPQGGRSRTPHLAFMPLPDVGHAYSDGRLLGLAIVMPREIDASEVERCLAPLFAHADSDAMRLYDGRAFEWSVSPESRPSPPIALRPRTWVRASRRWATVTPMAFDRHSKRNKQSDRAAEHHESVTRACRAIGLPEPARVTASPVSRIRGVPHVRDFPALRRRSDAGRTHKAHLDVEFPEPVCGPVLLGAGRFRGYGVCRPLPEAREES